MPDLDIDTLPGPVLELPEFPFEQQNGSQIMGQGEKLVTDFRVGKQRKVAIQLIRKLKTFTCDGNMNGMSYTLGIRFRWKKAPLYCLAHRDDLEPEDCLPHLLIRFDEAKI